jgi:hypothetical protein
MGCIRAQRISVCAIGHKVSAAPMQAIDSLQFSDKWPRYTINQ